MRPAPVITDAKSVDAIIRRDQAVAVLRGTNATLASNVFVSCSLAGMLWELIPQVQVLAFLLANAGVNGVRAVLARRWLRQALAGRAPERVLTLCWIGALLSGLCWAAALVGCAYHGQAYTVAVGLAFCGLNAGSVIQNKVACAPAIAFILPNIPILILLFVVEQSVGSQIIAVNLILLTALMLRCSVEQERHYLASSRLRCEALVLTESLKAANIAAGQALHRLEHAATRDHLTGLYNRAAYQKAIQARLVPAPSAANAFWILLINLDRFKTINETLGHAVGDSVLVEVGAELRRILGPEAVIARLGGDEFAALVGGPAGDAAVIGMAQEIVLRLGDLIALSGQTLPAGASVGLAHFPSDGSTLAELQFHADLALDAAKSEGHGTWRPFAEAMRQSTRAKREIERGLPEALRTRAIQAWFQPQVDCESGRVVGFEALLRWQHPVFGWVSPPDVIAAAAATRQSRALTHAILKDACRMAQGLDAYGHPDVVVSINVSPNEFGTYPIADLVAAELEAHRLPASRLAIEITEEAVYCTERGGSDVEALTRMGVGIIVDDFGVAYSSIGSLRDPRFDSLKIDRSFIRDVVDNPHDRVLVEAILAFARTIGVKVVAEGVETRAQFELLRQLGCPTVQGYHFARAMPKAEALSWIGRNTATLGLGLRRPPRTPAALDGRRLANA